MAVVTQGDRGRSLHPKVKLVSEGKEQGVAAFIAASPSIRELLRLACQVARTDATVLLLGESGTGKDLLARAIHEESPRKAGPFVKVDCAAIPEPLLESELFGYEKGAFTDAVRQKPGRLELAQGGTLFLDEVGELSLSLQAKLLRVLEERAFERVGGTAAIQVDVRIIAATNKNLEEALRQGRFREDLYFRLNVFPLHIPPLRRRGEDIPLLARVFLTRYARKYGKEVDDLSPEALNLLLRYPWPGNIRELEHTIERAVILSEGPIVRPDDINLDLLAFGTADGSEEGGMTLRELEREYIRRVLKKVRGHKGRAAKILGINRKTLLEKRRRYGLD